jgi:glycosyltransferase involved in cell wall biosynthesis
VNNKIINLNLILNPSDEDFILTIVIPTYNRFDNLINLISFIDKNAGQKTCVCIIDNGSSYKCDYEIIKNLIKRVNVKIYFNKYHLGPDASVLRAMEIPDTPWIYLLGDSKLPRADYLKKLEDDCLAHEDAMGIVYRFRNTADANLNIHTIDELKKNITDLGDLFLGGNSLISKRSIDNYFSMATMYTLTRMPHILFHLLALREGKAVHVSNNRLIEKFVPKPAHYDPGLSLIECWSQFALILTLPFNINELKIINRMILGMENWSSIINFCKFCLLQIFRYRKDIRPHLLRIIKYRYIYAIFSYEKLFIYPIYFTAIIFTPLIVFDE